MKRPVGIIAILSLALAISLITACGGGGGGDLSSDLPGTYELIELVASEYADNTCAGASETNNIPADDDNYGDWFVGETETAMNVTVERESYVSDYGQYTLVGSLDDFTITVGPVVTPVGVAAPLVVASSYYGSYVSSEDPDIVVLTDNVCRADGAEGKKMIYTWERVSDSTEMP
jgi:hypothetical protein